MNSKNLLPSIEDAVELSGIETLHPGGLDLSKRIGEVVDMKNKKVLEVLLEANARYLPDLVFFFRLHDKDRPIYALAIYHAVILFSIKKAGATAIGSWRWLRDRGPKWSSERLRKMPKVLIWLCKADTRALESWNPGPLSKKALTRAREREDTLSND